MAKNGRFSRQITFEDLRGLRAEGYVRDSTLDQRDGFGPEIQRHAIERFADSYGLVMGNRWYTEFLSGRSSKNRTQFQQFLEGRPLGLIRCPSRPSHEQIRTKPG